MKASVIIPNLNGAGWLRDSIESIWAQTEPDFELIVVDNGSTDESLAIARSYCGRARYTLIENSENTGFPTRSTRASPLPKANTSRCSTTTLLPNRSGWPSCCARPKPTNAFLP